MVAKPRRPIRSLTKTPVQPRRCTSEVLLAIVKHSEQQEMTLRSMTDNLGDRTFGVMLIMLAAISILPLLSIIGGFVVAALGIQMAIGMTRVRLPSMILDRQLPAPRVRAALLAAEPQIRSIEKFIKPRWHFTEAPLVDRIIGLIISILGVIIAIPLPFTNVGPSLAIMVMGLGLLERDGLVQILALALCSGIIALVYILL